MTGTIATQQYVEDALAEMGSANEADYNKIETTISNLVNYLYNWIDVGNLNMKDIYTEVDEYSILSRPEDEGGEGN